MTWMNSKLGNNDCLFSIQMTFSAPSLIEVWAQNLFNFRPFSPKRIPLVEARLMGPTTKGGILILRLTTQGRLKRRIAQHNFDLFSSFDPNNHNLSLDYQKE